MRIAVSGSSGFIGSAALPFLAGEGHHIERLNRQFDNVPLEGFDAVIHLAGANIGRRWDQAYKKVILESRVSGTRHLCRTLAGLEQKPKVLLSASAVGYYGNHGPDVVLDEDSPNGRGFLPEVCRLWEQETKAAQDAGIRVVNMRMGMVLGRSGGALAKILPPFRWGLGGVLGSGRQMMSWVALDEVPLIMAHLIANEGIRGPVNIVSPYPVSNREFTEVLGQVVKRPAVLPVPGFMIRLLFGEMGQTLLLEGNRAFPRRLQESGYQFRYADIKTALEKAIH